MSRGFALLAAGTLAACGGESSIAELSGMSVGSTAKGPTPNISIVTLQAQTLDGLSAIEYVVQTKVGGVSKPVHVTVEASYLQKRGYVSADGKTIQLPLFGLYAGRRSSVSLDADYSDGSKQHFDLSLPTDAITGDDAVYATPEVLRARSATDVLPYDFFYVKAGTGAPVVIDTDGEVRWTGTQVPSSFSTIFQDGSFYVGGQSALELRKVSLDGGVDLISMSDNVLTSFHHNLEFGKTGFLGEFEGTKNGIDIVESIVAEIDENGRILKSWNLGDIIGQYMQANGDSPAAFVRDGVDWFHNNSAIYDPSDDSLIVSSRENFVIKLDYETGAIKWIFGDPTKYWPSFPSLQQKAVTLAAGGWYPIGQHALSLNAAGELMLFNNGTGSYNQPAGAPAGQTRTSSVVSTYRIDPAQFTAVETARFDNGNSIYSSVCSSAYEIGNGPLLVSYAMADSATHARIVGVDASGNVVMDLQYPANNCQTSWNAQPIAFDAMLLK